MQVKKLIWLGVCSMILATSNTYAEKSSVEAATESRLERGKRLLTAIDGEAGQAVVDSLQEIAPDFSNYLFEYPFGDIYARPGLDLASREKVTIAALAAMGNAQPQLKVHIAAALNVGVKPQEIVEIMIQMSVYAGFPAALNGLKATQEVFKAKNISLPKQP